MLPLELLSPASIDVLPPAPVDNKISPELYATAAELVVVAAASPVITLIAPLDPPFEELAAVAVDTSTDPDTAVAASSSADAPVTKSMLPPATPVPVTSPELMMTAPPVPVPL
jgi:hypothetical protein